MFMFVYVFHYIKGNYHYYYYCCCYCCCCCCCYQHLYNLLIFLFLLLLLFYITKQSVPEWFFLYYLTSILFERSMPNFNYQLQYDTNPRKRVSYWRVELIYTLNITDRTILREVRDMNNVCLMMWQKRSVTIYFLVYLKLLKGLLTLKLFTYTCMHTVKPVHNDTCE